MLPFCYPYYHGRALGFTLDEIDVRIFRLAVEKAFSWLYSLTAGFADRCGAPLKMDVLVGVAASICIRRKVDNFDNMFDKFDTF